MFFPLVKIVKQEKLHEVVKVGERGQVTIPSSIREIENIRKGELLEVVYRDGTILMTKLDKRGNLELALKLLGRGLAAAGYREKDDIMRFSEKIREKVHKEWTTEM
jgi:AbrB family looped-hinge helix DNA binding protein